MKTQTLQLIVTEHDTDLADFESFLDYNDRLEHCISLYVTWGAIFYSSGLIEHYESMQRAKELIVDFKKVG